MLTRAPRFAALAGIAVAVLVAIASLGGIAVPATYARETPAWRAQGIAQDWVDLVVAAPWLAIAALGALRGSRRATLLLGGGLAYAAYSFAIYAFAVHFNALFLVYVAVLGLSAWGLADLGRARLDSGSDARAPRRLAGGTLIACGVLFTLLWLAQIVPALVDGTSPPGLDEAGLVTNPVHVLDLALVLPLFFVAGDLLWRGRALGDLLGAILLGFSVLMFAALFAITRSLALAVPIACFALVLARLVTTTCAKLEHPTTTSGHLAT